MKKILMIGGSHFQIPAIKYARDVGYYVITADYSVNNPGHKYSHEYYNVSTIDKDAVLKLAQELRKEKAQLYDKLLKDNKQIYFPNFKKNNFSYYPVIFKDSSVKNTIKDKLESFDIYVREYFKPSLDRVFSKNNTECPISNDLSEKILCLPIFPDLDNSIIFKISDTFNSI